MTLCRKELKVGKVFITQMNALVIQIRRRLFRISQDAVTFERRGFRGADPGPRQRLETVGNWFLAGYHFAVESSSVSELKAKLDSVEPELRGFAYEGAAMGLAILDRVTPWRARRFESFLAGPGAAHAYMFHVGLGWVWARAPFGFRRWQKRLDPLLGWLAFDGWGFHEGFFRGPGYLTGQAAPMRLRGYQRRVFDQGLGRSFWFVNGGSADRIAQTISNFSTARQPDLWSGVGLAAGYAGIASESSLHQLRTFSGRFHPQLAQGAAFAAKARQRAGNPAEHTDLAARILCGSSAEEAARLTDISLENLPADGPEPAYEIWRQRIQSHFQDRFASAGQLQGAT